MANGFPDGLVITPDNWPNGLKDDAPGNEKFFLKHGLGLIEPGATIFPYRDQPDESYYGMQDPKAHPIYNAPLQGAHGGTIYFETRAEEKLKTVIDVLDLRTNTVDYVAYAYSSHDPVTDKYLDQMKLVSHMALQYIFHVAESDLPNAQTLTLGNAVVEFVQAQARKWNEPGTTFSPRLSGAAGGDGDWAKESLAFGLHIENEFWGVYRIWSRAWLVTK